MGPLAIKEERRHGPYGTGWASLAGGGMAPPQLPLASMCLPSRGSGVWDPVPGVPCLGKGRRLLAHCLQNHTAGPAAAGGGIAVGGTGAGVGAAAGGGGTDAPEPFEEEGAFCPNESVAVCCVALCCCAALRIATTQSGRAVSS